MKLYQSFIKRPADIFLSALLIIALLPLFAALYVIVRCAMGSPALFRQARPGRGGRIFEVLKFRSMSSETDENGSPLPDEMRMTRLGGFLRRSSLDELPQLFNILKGDMSFVGPRPLLVEYLPLYSESQRRRHEIRPGVTGWAQVNGRNAISWGRKLELDEWYVDHVSFLLDLKIMLMTVGKVLAREGISQDGRATTESFKGDN